MTNDTELTHLQNIARSFVRTLSLLPKKELAGTITSHYAQEYNKIQNLVDKACPELGSLLPGAVGIHQGADHIPFCRSAYVEIMTYCDIIVGLLTNVAPSEVVDVDE